MGAEFKCRKGHRYSLPIVDVDSPKECPLCAASELAQLRSENASLRQDALRYRWLRNSSKALVFGFTPDQLDTWVDQSIAIDAAMEKKP